MLLRPRRFLFNNTNIPGLTTDAIEVNDTSKPYFTCLLNNEGRYKLDKLIKGIFLRIVLLDCYNHKITNTVKITFVKDYLFYELDEIITITPNTNIFTYADDL